MATFERGQKSGLLREKDSKFVLDPSKEDDANEWIAGVIDEGADGEQYKEFKNSQLPNP